MVGWWLRGWVCKLGESGEEEGDVCVLWWCVLLWCGREAWVEALVRREVGEMGEPDRGGGARRHEGEGAKLAENNVEGVGGHPHVVGVAAHAIKIGEV